MGRFSGRFEKQIGNTCNGRLLRIYMNKNTVLIEAVNKQFKDFLKLFLIFSILIMALIFSSSDHSKTEITIQSGILLLSLLFAGIIIFKKNKSIELLDKKLEIYSKAQQQGLSRITPTQEAAEDISEDAETDVESESVAQEQVAAFEEEIKSLKTKLAEKEEIINKNGWKKWCLAACSAMGEIIRENTVNSSSPVTIKRDAFFERIKSNYPDQNEKEFGSAFREAWKCVPDTVKHTDGSS
ncbi:hypothetical protein [Desulfovibrio sp. JC010]|uniref:hypothetical protein n=1 Tax=Desulfovibrio sp. JC010 TaxID=2593641 RepID=UPI0013D8ADC2|nr:hypothetical protein [Desulfovibrio sp. JC010]NDV28801.1 hypothetical protein [Desulfovibrio sp. JC010]